MAKLNITFVNEVGNNLNRYKAIDVNTGDEYLFDLSRNGTITTPGTPLNAEIMNAIVQAINEHFSNIVVEINDTTPSDTKYPSEKAVVDYVGQISNEESVNVSDNVLIKISGVSDNLAIPPESQMEVNSIEGNSVVVNQYRKARTGANAGITWTLTADGTLTFSGTSTVGTEWSMNFIEDVIPKGHKYLFWCSKKSEYLKNWLAFNNNNILIASKSNGIFELNNDANDVGLSFKIPEGTTIPDNTVAATNIVIIDLTQWFGSNDNIPQDILNTPSNFFKYYKGSLAYDTGHIENGSGNLVDTNRNIWDEEWEVGAYDVYGDGSKVALADNIRNKNYIQVKPNTTYYCKNGSRASHSDTIGCFYDINKNYLGYNTIGNTTFTTPTNSAFMTFYTLGTTYKHDICINKSDPNFNGTYVKHIKNTLNFGNDILRSAGNVRDNKIPDGEITRKVGRVDLGTLTWEYGGGLFSSALNGSITGVNLLCSLYEAREISGGSSPNDKDKTIYNYNGTVHVKDSSYTDAAAFKAAMSGVYLNYELATPTTEQGTPYDNYIPVYYGGQEYLTGDVPFVINKNYDISIKDQVITNVRVDKEQSEQIHALENVNREQSNAIDSLQNEVSNKVDKVEGKGLSSNDYTNEEKERISNLENSQFDSSKLTIEQNLVNTILKYNNVEINRIENLDVAYLPNIVFDVYRDSQYTAQEKVTITNSTDIDMYVSIKGLKEHNNLFVPFGESVTSTLEIDLNFPNSYTATIEIKIYYNPKTNYSAATGYTLFENVKTINLRATVHTTDR